jgi:phosphate transport system substrate-binding protein
LLEVPEGQDFICPECTRQLNIVEQQASSTGAIMLVAVVLLILGLLGGGAWYALKLFSPRGAQNTASSNSATPVPGVPPSGNTAPVAGGRAEVILRLHGSNTIGAQLAPGLAQAYLKQQGAQDVTVVRGSGDSVTVQGTVSGSREAIEIVAQGSQTAFADLASGKCDIGMASRKIKPDEVASLSSLGDMTSPASEHVLGLDGIAVIVNSANPVTALTTAQLAGVFSGSIADWSGVGGGGGAIRVYARDDKSGTYDTFKSLVLGDRNLASSAARFEDSRQLADKVAGDPNGIGFVGMPYISGSKALAISEKGARPLMPSRLTVATEDYALSRRLYLYTASNPSNTNVRRFVTFALSKQGQDVVGDNGFIAQNVRSENVSVPVDSPSEYAKLTAKAQRLSLNFRFRTGSSQVDNKALVDLDRVVSFISDLRYTGREVMLFGFADSTGGEAVNDRLAKERAHTVADQFEQRGLKPGMVTGFGSHNPVASNDTDEGRQKNRRVEIWIKQAPGA